VPTAQSGVGEPRFAAIAPAVANALFPTTGRHIRALPLRNGASISYNFGANSMCRNIKTLFNFKPPATGEEIPASRSA
jgi:hypothetical protein